jgi:hypothetical protein
MSLDDFWDKFASIESQKDPTRKNPATGRFPIGQFGIGSFALVPFSRKLTLYSKQYQKRPIKCVIHAVNLQEETADDFAGHVRNNIEDKEISDEEWETAYGSPDPGTLIVIHGVTAETYAELVDGVGRFEDGGKSMFTDAPYTTGLKEIAWELSTLLPLNYADDPSGISKSHKTSLKSNNPGIHITLSEVPLRREIYSGDDSIAKAIDYREAGVRAKGVLVARHEGPVQPRDANGVILRLNNVGIGGYSLFGHVGQATIRQRLTGEVHILDGLHDALNAARDRFSGPAYDRLKAHLLQALQELSSDADSAWKEGRRRKEEQAEREKQARHKKFYEEQQRQKREQEEKRKRAQTEEQQAENQQGGKPDRGKDNAGAEESPKKTEQAKKPEKTEQPPTTGQRGANAEARKEEPKPFFDPVVSVRHSTGEITVDVNHPIFKVFKGKREQETIKAVLRAMKAVEVPKEVYQRVVEALLSMR